MPEQERRHEERLSMGKMILIVPWHEGRAGTPRKARLLDWSPHGLGIVDPEDLRPGDQFAVSVNLNQTTMALYTVRHSATVEQGVHQIGAEICGFVSAPEEPAAEALPSLLGA